VIKTAPDQGDFPIKRTQSDGSSKDDIIPFLHHRSTVCFSYSPSNQQEDFHPSDRTLSDIPLTSVRETPKVMLLEELMTLVLCTKSIGQWCFPLINRTIRYFTA
jgi:hypothetical protein